MRENRLSKINRSINHWLFLLAFQYTWYDRLRGDTVASKKFTKDKLLIKKHIDKKTVRNLENAPVIDNNGAEGVETGQIHGRVYSDALKIIARRNKGCSVTT